MVSRKRPRRRLLKSRSLGALRACDFFDNHCETGLNGVTIPSTSPARTERPNDSRAEVRAFAKGVGPWSVLNAFIGKAEQPSSEEIAAALGPAAGLVERTDRLDGSQAGVPTQEWRGIYVHKYGWSLKLKLKKRTIVHLGPCQGCFRAAFILSDKAMAAAKEAKFPKKIQQALAEAPRYPEGNGLRLVVTRAADLAAIRKLAEIKLAN